MSQGKILYAQANPLPGEELKNIPSADLFRVWIERAFGHWPVELDKNAIPTLQGMQAVQGDVGSPFADLIRAIRRYGAIRIWADYNDEERPTK